MCFEMDNRTDRILLREGCKFTLKKTILFYLWLSRDDEGEKKGSNSVYRRDM